MRGWVTPGILTEHVYPALQWRELVGRGGVYIFLGYRRGGARYRTDRCVPHGKMHQMNTWNVTLIHSVAKLYHRYLYPEHGSGRITTGGLSRRQLRHSVGTRG